MSALSLYEQMSGLTDQMVHAARENDWDRLCVLEQEVAALRQRLVMNDPLSAAMPLDETERRRKAELIKQMLADDREIRRHTEPWMEGVRQMLSSGNRTRNLRATYGPHMR